MLGIPIGNPAFVRSELRKKTVLHSVLLDRIPVVQDLSAWLLLLYCAKTRANYWLRGVPPEDVAQFASEHDVATQSCLSRLLGAGLTQDAQDLASLPLSLGGCGLRSASRSKEAAHWASWADSLRMIHQRHPDVAALMVRALSSAEEGRHLQAAESCRLQLLSLGGFVPPEWHAAAEARPRFLANVEHYGNEPGVPARGWQFEASQRGEFLLPPLHPPLFSCAVRPLEVPGWALLWFALHRFPYFHSPAVRFGALSRSSLPSSSSSSPSFVSYLPVWPSSRRPWPPPRSVLDFWGAWKTRLRARVCCGTHLP